MTQKIVSTRIALENFCFRTILFIKYLRVSGNMPTWVCLIHINLTLQTVIKNVLPRL